jgi:cytidyltransferase-like protein
MINDTDGYAMFLGRWQPLHEGHKQLFNQVLNQGSKICVMIRDIQPDDKNPYSAVQVKETIQDFYKDEIIEGNLIVLIVPNITSINFGRGVGYDVVEFIPPSEIAEISATEIRETLRNNGKL